jgi:hypothetical protein
MNWSKCWRNLLLKMIRDLKQHIKKIIHHSQVDFAQGCKDGTTFTNQGRIKVGNHIISIDAEKCIVRTFLRATITPSNTTIQGEKMKGRRVK